MDGYQKQSISIEIRVISCKNLNAFNFFQKLSVYALVSIVSDDPDKKLEQTKQHRTPTDTEGDGNPEWNYELCFDLDEASVQDCDHLFVQFQLYHEGKLFGDKNIGQVRVQVKDLIEESNGVIRFASYEVRTTDGKPNGVLDFSYKVNRKDKEIGTSSSGDNISGYQMTHHQLPEIQFPSSDVHSSSIGLSYPSLEFQEPAQHQTYSAPQQYPPHGNSYPPLDAYCGPRPPPPPPPPPAIWHEPLHHFPHPPGFYPYNEEDYGFSERWTGRSYPAGEAWPHGFWTSRHHHSSSYRS